MKYYYLAASLPGLTLESPAPISFDSFVATCAEHLCGSDMAALSSIAQTGKKSRHSFVKEWNEKETLLRNALARTRAQRLNRDPALYTKETKSFDSYIEKTVSDAYSKSTPLDRELTIDKLRWKTADELAGFDPFSGSAILAYAMKLKINERWAGLDEARAKNLASEIINKTPESDKTNT